MALAIGQEETALGIREIDFKDLVNQQTGLLVDSQITDSQIRVATNDQSRTRCTSNAIALL
jgi:hypothetical protein